MSNNAYFRGVFMVKRILIAFCMILSMNHVYGMQFLKTYFSPLRFDKKEALTSEVEKFSQQFSPPKAVQETIEKNRGNIDPQLKVQFLPGSQPPVYLKVGDPDRIIYAASIAEFIKKNHFQHLEVPKKYFYKVGNDWKVIAEAIDASVVDRTQLTLEEVKELTTLIEASCYNDTNNIVRNKQNGKLALIDTEDLSFCCLPKASVMNIFYWNWIQYVQNNEAKKWFSDYLSAVEKSEDAQDPCKSICGTTEFNRHKIDLKKTKNELHKINIYNKLLTRLDKCVADADAHREDDTPLDCSTWIKQLKETNDELAREHNYRRNDIVGKRKEFIEYLKSIKGRA
jgi:hypothetical protein